MPADFSWLFERLADPWFTGALAAGLIIVSGLWGWRLRVTAHRAELDQYQRWLDEHRQHVASANGRIDQLQGDLRDVRGELRQRLDEVGERRAAEAALRARLEDAERHFGEKEATFQREFELLANRIFERHGEQHQARLDTVLGPFKEQIGEFRQRVEAVYDGENRDRASLLAEVRNLQQASDRINREAENLTRALKGDVKVQGNWGEMVLERVLEGSGLRAGEEYFVQQSRRDAEGSLKRPDVLIRLPDDKDVVVDAKLSLLAYEQALSEGDDSLRAEALGRHVASVRAHVKRLAEQEYDRLDNVRSLDFVLLFVPIEGAFSLAMEHDQKLFTEAFERRIVIVSPTTLMMTLRIIHNVRRYEKQNRNAQEIARRAGALYDKLCGFVDDLETLGRQLQTADNTHKALVGKLSTGRGNLLRRVESFRELGAPVKKALPPHLLGDEAPEDQELTVEDFGDEGDDPPGAAPDPAADTDPDPRAGRPAEPAHTGNGT